MSHYIPAFSSTSGYIKRVIVHPAFLNASFKEAESELNKMDHGEAIFRPSSKVSCVHLAGVTGDHFHISDTFVYMYISIFTYMSIDTL